VGHVRQISEFATKIISFELFRCSLGHDLSHLALLRKGDQTQKWNPKLGLVFSWRLARMEGEMRRILQVPVLLMLFAIPSNAQEQRMDIGRGVLCDTAKQMGRSVTRVRVAIAPLQQRYDLGVTAA
jgi:hypothetical protein